MWIIIFIQVLQWMWKAEYNSNKQMWWLSWISIRKATEKNTGENNKWESLGKNISHTKSMQQTCVSWQQNKT